MNRLSRYLAMATFGALTAFAGSGCSLTRSELRLESILAQAAIQPKFTLGCYIPSDKNVADVYLSDISADRLADLNDPLTDVTGSIVHVHLFLVPEAGSTPIADTACNATVRQFVLAGARPGATGPAVGVYGGGGFFFPDRQPGASSFDAELRDATLRLSHATPGFADRLGACRMSGDVSARRDDALCRIIAQRLDALIVSTQSAPTAAPSSTPTTPSTP